MLVVIYSKAGKLLTVLEQVSHAANYLEKQGSFIEEIKAKIWAIDGSELPDARSAAKEAVEVLCSPGSFVPTKEFSSALPLLE
jgi:hypothetical protein